MRFWSPLLCCSPSVAEAITLIPVASGEPNLILWSHSSDSAFSLKSAWELVRLRNHISDNLTSCWGSWLRPTMSFFLWRFWHQWLPTDDVLQRRGIVLVSKCQCCDMSKTFTHIFIDSPIARSVLNFFGAIFRVRIPRTEETLRISDCSSVRGRRIRNGYLGVMSRSFCLVVYLDDSEWCEASSVSHFRGYFQVSNLFLPASRSCCVHC